MKGYYTNDEKKLLKVMKMNQDDSLLLLGDSSLATLRNEANAAIADSLNILQQLGRKVKIKADNSEQFSSTVEVQDFETVAAEAENRYKNAQVTVEDILSSAEIQKAQKNVASLEKEFSSRTSIFNKTDLAFLAIATALQTAKSLLFPVVAGKFGYGKSFDKATRLPHDDKSITNAHKQANNEFRDKQQKTHKNGKWIELLYQPPAYDITRGSGNINFNMEGGYHRLHTLGHDPILGWIFGTANILTDIITLNDLRSFRVDRKPTMHITAKRVTTPKMFMECKEMIDDDFLNLPAAIFAQYQHFKSDVFTKCGLPVPLLEAFAPDFAGDLYKSQYDALCFSRDVKIVGTSAAVTMLIDMIIGLVHRLFYKKSEEKSSALYEVRTRKILLVSGILASSSSIIYSSITANPKNLDIGGLLVTVSKLFRDVRFILRIKQEFIERELYKQMQGELDTINQMIAEMK